MSAWIASEKHISTLAGYLAVNTKRKVNVKWYATRLMKENVRSVDHRYSEKNKNRWVGSEEDALTLGGGIGPVTAIKLAGSLDYQSCEHDAWEASLAYKILVKITKIARAKLAPQYRNLPACDLPGYNDAPWSI